MFTHSFVKMVEFCTRVLKGLNSFEDELEREPTTFILAGYIPIVLGLNTDMIHGFVVQRNLCISEKYQITGDTFWEK